MSIWPTERAPGSHTRSFCTCQGLRPRRNDWALAISHPFVLPSAQLTASALGKTFFRGSMAGLCTPLPTLRRHPHGCLRTARGRRGSLLPHRSGLPPPTPCRSPGAPTVMLSSLVCLNKKLELVRRPRIQSVGCDGPPAMACTVGTEPTPGTGGAQKPGARAVNAVLTVNGTARPDSRHGHSRSVAVRSLSRHMRP